jgi:hypothetical protein
MAEVTELTQAVDLIVDIGRTVAEPRVGGMLAKDDAGGGSGYRLITAQGLSS